MDDDSSEKEENELVEEPSHNDVSLRNQKRAELLRRIEELDRRLAVLKGERRLLQSLRANRAGLANSWWPRSTNNWLTITSSKEGTPVLAEPRKGRLGVASMDLDRYFASLSLDELWELQERISALLEARIIAENQLIEEQLNEIDAEGQNRNDKKPN